MLILFSIIKKMKSLNQGDLMVGILIPLASVIGLVVGILWWTNNKKVLQNFKNVWLIFAVIGVAIGVYYSVAWIPKAFK
jgi:predicted cation transporter